MTFLSVPCLAVDDKEHVCGIICCVPGDLIYSRGACLLEQLIPKGSSDTKGDSVVTLAPILPPQEALDNGRATSDVAGNFVQNEEPEGSQHLSAYSNRPTGPMILRLEECWTEEGGRWHHFESLGF